MRDMPAQPQSRRRRPLGVVLLSALWLGYGALAVLFLLEVPDIPIAGMARLVLRLGLLEAAHAVLVAIAALTAVGLWFLRPWGWVLAMLMAGVSLAFDILWYVQGAPAYAYMALGVAIAFYLNQGDVRERFFSTSGRLDPPPVVDAGGLRR